MFLTSVLSLVLTAAEPNSAWHVSYEKATDQAKTIASQATNAAKGIQDCVAKAGTDPQKLAACAGQ